MKKIDLVTGIQVVANLGVLAGIVFLAVELRQNNQLMVSQTRSDIAESIAGSLSEISLSSYFEQVALPEQIESSGSVEQHRLQIYQLASLRRWENIHYQWRNGLYEDSEFRAERNVWARSINLPSKKGIFCSSREGFSEEFAAELESIMEVPC